MACEWLASEDERGERLKSLRLVHRLSRSAGPNGPNCRYDSVWKFRNDRSIVEGLSLERFVGSDGLMLLLSFLASGEMPCGDVLELAKRVQVPGYEQARELFSEAIGMGIFSPAIGEGYYMQSEIWELLGWASGKPDRHGCTCELARSVASHFVVTPRPTAIKILESDWFTVRSRCGRLGLRTSLVLQFCLLTNAGRPDLEQPASFRHSVLITLPFAWFVHPSVT